MKAPLIAMPLGLSSSTPKTYYNHKTAVITELGHLEKLFDKWCKETKRSGGVLIGGSVREFLRWLEVELIKEK